VHRSQRLRDFWCAKMGKLWVLLSIELVRVERSPHGHRAVETIEMGWWRRGVGAGETTKIGLVGSGVWRSRLSTIITLRGTCAMRWCEFSGALDASAQYTLLFHL